MYAENLDEERAESHHELIDIHLVSPKHLAVICNRVAETITDPDKLTNEFLSIDAQKRPVSVYSEEVHACDLLGWVTRYSQEYFFRVRPGRKTVGNTVAMIIDSQIRIMSEDKERLLSLGDREPRYAVRYFRRMALLFSKMKYLPPIYAYGKNSDSVVKRPGRGE